jgi:hypothetical protein
VWSAPFSFCRAYVPRRFPPPWSVEECNARPVLMNAQTKRTDYYDANESGNEAVLNDGGGSYASDQTGQNGFYRARVYAKPLPLAIKTDRFLRTVVTTAKFGNVDIRSQTYLRLRSRSETRHKVCQQSQREHPRLNDEEAPTTHLHFE